MPVLKIETNVQQSPAADHEAVAAASRAVADMLGKPEGYVMVTLTRPEAMCFAGTTAPLAYVELKSLGLPEQRTADFSARLCALLQEQLGVPANRVYIEFASPPGRLFGHDSGTF